MEQEISIIPVILAGGEGKRLFPYSTPENPKQFLSVDGNLSLLQQTVLRVTGEWFHSPVILTSHRYADRAMEQMAAIGVTPWAVIEEPEKLNTAPAIALAIAQLQSQLYTHEPLLILPSDHIITHNADFQNALLQAVELSEEASVVTLGITPNTPSPSYGYIHCGNRCSTQGINAYSIEKFTEKPDAATAEKYIQSGNHLWNSGIFVMRCNRAMEIFLQYAPEIWHDAVDCIRLGKSSSTRISPNAEIFSGMTSIAFDYAIMEHIKDAAVIPINVGWDDLGTTQQFERYLMADA